MRKLHHHLYFWVVCAIVAGGLFGWLAPHAAVQLKPLGDAFIALIKMLIGPIIFCTVTRGLAGAGDVKTMGRVGAKTLLYFEIVSTIALVLGLIVANVLKPGAGLHADPNTLDQSAVAHIAESASEHSVSSTLLHIIPRTFFDAFAAGGDLLQILLVALLFGYALNRVRDRSALVFEGLEQIAHVFFRVVNAVMKLAPLGAGGAMAFTVGQYGVASLEPMVKLMLCFYLTCVLFVGFVLGLVARITGFNIVRFLGYVREELLIVLGTSSSESALAPLMTKLERLGCAKSIVGLVVPAGYSFNLDGTNIYLTMATLFVAQALGIDLTLGQQLSVLVVAILTSKGASGVTGAGFVTLAATLAVVPDVPVAGLTLILGVDRFMSEARAITNMIGNGVATIVIAKWEGQLDETKLKSELEPHRI
jgi:aerobic C4-dicarboxylate transport protein